jgi:hypothetical protein
LHPAWSPPGSVLGVVALYLIGGGVLGLIVVGSRTSDEDGDGGEPDVAAMYEVGAGAGAADPGMAVVAPGNGMVFGGGVGVVPAQSGRISDDADVIDPGLLAGPQRSAPGGR